MAFTITKVPDGDDVWGRTRIEEVQLQPAISDYVAGGYLLQGISGTTETTGNVGLAKVNWAIPCGGQQNLLPVFNPTTSKIQIFSASSASGIAEVPAGTNLAGFTFNLLVGGY